MKISWSTIIGILGGFGLFLYAIYVSTDHWVIFVSLASVAMVLGGTIGATLVAYQGLYVYRTLRALLAILVPATATPKQLFHDVETIIGWSDEVKKKGVAVLDDKVEAGEASHMGAMGTWGLELVSNGYKGEELRVLLEDYITNEYLRSQVQVGVLRTMATFAPAFGMVGTLVGLVIMLDQLQGDPSSIGQGLALALITTLYGVVFANLIFKPAALKTEQKNQINRFRNQLIAEGLIGLSNRSDPLKLQDKLNSFLDSKIHFDLFSSIKEN